MSAQPCPSPVSYSSFCKTHNTLAPFAQTVSMRYIYEQIICRPDVVGWMIIASELKLPALAACAGEIERWCAANGLDLEDQEVRKAIGRMASAALKPAGYVPVRSRSMPKELGLRHFHRTAKYYEKRGRPLVTVRVGLEPAQD